MKIYLAGNRGYRDICVKNIINKDMTLNILETFYTITDKTAKFIPLFDNFMLDSGAFTFMNSTKNVDWNKYIEDYADFINKYDIKYFFELDIDNIIGYDSVKKLRYKLENLTNKKCIPVWHKSRGLEEYIKLTKQYDYIAIGGIVTKEINKTEYRYFKELINIAHKNNCKVHGLGFTPLKLLEKYHFDSVDSSSWVYGNKIGYIYKFDGKRLRIINRPLGTKIKPKEVMINNFIEWCKFVKYAEKHL